MRSLVLNHQHEGFLLVPAALEPGDGFIHHRLGHVFTRLSLHLAGRRLEFGRVVGSLAGKHVPEIKPLWIRAQVPLADEGGLVAAFLQDLRKGLLVTVEYMVVLEETVQVGMLAGLDDSATGTAESVGDEAIIKADALVGNAVEVRSRRNVLETPPIG